jgi:hypothetical protein
MTTYNTPRYEVIAEYPQGAWAIGTILVPDENGEMYSKKHGYSQSSICLFLEDIDKYPHLFRKLKWWELIPKQSLPEYVKGRLLDSIGNGVFKVVWKVERKTLWVREHDHKCFSYFLDCDLQPATESEYKEYINKN